MLHKMDESIVYKLRLFDDLLPGQAGAFFK